MKSNNSFIIQGLSGAKSLKGTVSINGAKNAALKAMAASVLFHGPVTLQNIPDTCDIHTMSELLQKLGATITFNGKGKRAPNGSHEMIVNTSKMNSTSIDASLATIFRASVVLTGPMLSRFGSVTFPLPGGCVIGARPIDLFIKGYEKMGATAIEEQTDYLITGKLNGAHIKFEKISVGATETLMMAAVLANGRTILENCAKEPEIVNVAEWLNVCGAHISGIGTEVMEIEGTGGKLLEPLAPYVAIPDRIEAGSFLILGALCASEFEIQYCEPKHLTSLITALTGAGVPIEVGSSSLTIKGNTMPNSTFKAFDVDTREYPGFPTDLQSPIVAFLTQVSGESTVMENIFEGRFKYVEDLKNIGADIAVKGPREVSIIGPTPLSSSGGNIESGKSGDVKILNAHDIRAGFAVVVAALVGVGKFKINNVHLIDRGYEKLEERLGKLGAEIERRQ